MINDVVEDIELDIKIAERAATIKPSPTLAVTARAAKLRAEGHDIIGLGAGEPDFDTPEHIKAAAVKALQDGFYQIHPRSRDSRPETSHYQ